MQTPSAHKSEWRAIKNGRGEVKGYIEMFWCRQANGFVTIPDVSRFRSASSAHSDLGEKQ
jgi:hypothetical protein